MSDGCPCCNFLAQSDLFLPPGIYESSGHPDTAEESHSREGSPLSPLECWDQLRQLQEIRSDHGKNSPMAVDTHGHAHLGRDPDSLYTSEDSSSSLAVMSLTCAVEPADWDSCLHYSSQSPWRMAAIGVHPWYIADLDDSWLEDLEERLKQHPGCMVGEIGLCKMARFLRTYEKGKQAAIALQRQVFVKQLQLASKYRRPVTVHCVQQQGVLLEILENMQDALPPAIGLHSFTGTAHHVKKLLQWEKSLKLSEPLLYFGFSHVVNYAMCSSEKSRRQGREAVAEVPPDRLLCESDVHHDSDVALGTSGAIGYMAWARGESIAVVSSLTRRNGLRFLSRQMNEARTS